MARAQVEVQFNWVMILVAGALIFLFFFGIIRWVKQGSEASTSSTVSTYLDSILTGSSVAKDTVASFRIPVSEISLSCDTYSVGGVPKRIRNKIVFSPSRITGGEIVTWSQPWNVPFRVTNLLYLSSPNIRYVFFGDGGDTLFQQIQEAFPEELTSEFNPPLPLQDENHAKVRIVYINTPATLSPEAFRKRDGGDVTLLSVSGSDLSGLTQLTFSQKTHPSVTPQRFTGALQAGAYGKALLFAAIFSDLGEDYVCGQRKALERMRHVAAISAARAETLRESYAASGDAACESIFLSSSLPAYASAGLNELPGLANLLSVSNLNAQRNSCALLY